MFGISQKFDPQVYAQALKEIQKKREYEREERRLNRTFQELEAAGADRDLTPQQVSDYNNTLRSQVKAQWERIKHIDSPPMQKIVLKDEIEHLKTTIYWIKKRLEALKIHAENHPQEHHEPIQLKEKELALSLSELKELEDVYEERIPITASKGAQSLLERIRNSTPQCPFAFQ